MNKVSVKDITISIPVYPVGAPEKLPVFAENRVHQRMSGNPYPNAVTADVRASDKPERRELRAVVIENDYIRVTVLPEYGGRVFSAEDKTTGEGFSLPSARDKTGAYRSPWTLDIRRDRVQLADASQTVDIPSD